MNFKEGKTWWKGDANKTKKYVVIQILPSFHKKEYIFNID